MVVDAEVKNNNEDHSSEWMERCAQKRKKGDKKSEEKTKKDLTEPTLLEISGYPRGPRVGCETLCPRHTAA